MRPSYRYLVLSLLLAAALAGTSGCVPALAAAFSPTATPTATATSTHTPLPTVTPSATPIPSATPTPRPTLTPTATVTPTWAFQSGSINCPILLYHRIAEPPQGDGFAARYYVSPAEFEMQMQALHDWGYTPINISLLLEAVMKGAELPARPIVITFDDGDISVYTNALPIMERFGFIGVNYIVGNRLTAEGYMNVEQLRDLAARGWEVGSHSMSHIDLTLSHDSMGYEVQESRDRLLTEIGVPVNTFAYPFGTVDADVANAVGKAFYLGAVGLGTFYTHDWTTLYYLSRIEIRNGTPLEQMAKMIGAAP